MASVQKRGDSYRIFVSNGRDSQGRKIVETETWTPEPGMSSREIDVALRGFVADFERSVKAGKNVQGERLNINDLAELYLKDMKPPMLSRSTYHDYKDRLERRIIPAMGHIKAGNIRQRDVNNYQKMVRETYKVERTGQPLSESSIRKDCMVISALLSYAVAEGFLDMNMLIYSGRTRAKKSQKKEVVPKYFTPEQILRFIDALERPIEIIHKSHETTVRGKKYNVNEYTQTFQVKNKWKLYFYFALFCGDRRGENISLTWDDIDMEKCEVKIHASTDYVDGSMQLKDTKTHNVRDNTVPPYVMEIAKSWKNEQIQQSFILGEHWEGYKGKDFDKNFVFTQRTGKQMHISSPYTQYNRIIKLYNQHVADKENEKIPEDVPPHGLRHSAAAILIANNLDPRTVASILGHGNPTTTLNIYSYFFKNKGKEAANVMEKILLPDKVIDC